MSFSSRGSLGSLGGLEAQAPATSEHGGFAGNGQEPDLPEDVAESVDEESFDNGHFQLITLVSTPVARTAFTSHVESFKGRALFMDRWLVADNMNAAEWKGLAVLLEGAGCYGRYTVREPTAPAVACCRVVPCTFWGYNLLVKEAVSQGSALFMDHWLAADNMNAAQWKELAMLLEGDGSTSQCRLRKPTVPVAAYGRVVTSTASPRNPTLRGSNAVSEWSLVCDRH